MYSTSPSEELCAMLGYKECETLYCSFIRARVGTDSDRATSSLLSRLQQKQEQWEKAVNSIGFSLSCERRGEQSTNLQAGLDAPLACTLSWQVPSPCNLWRMGHTRPAATSPPGSSASSCPTYGRFQHLRVTVSPNLLGWRSFLLSSDAWSQESLRDWIPSSQNLYSTPGRLSNIGFVTSSLPACANSNFQRSGEEHY